MQQPHLTCRLPTGNNDPCEPKKNYTLVNQFNVQGLKSHVTAEHTRDDMIKP
jgi:hypothetical protein